MQYISHGSTKPVYNLQVHLSVTVMFIGWYTVLGAFEGLVPSADKREGERIEEILFKFGSLGRGVYRWGQVESEGRNETMSGVQ
jgi:hypothetical protein